MKSALFLYGTLREGGDLEHLLPQGLTRYGATVRGRLHYHRCGGYPVLIPSADAGDRVQGEIVWVNMEHPDVAYTILMELSSGYSATWAAVELNVGGRVDALTFTWHPADGVGPRIEGDDWSKRHGTHSCFECGADYPTTSEAIECEWTHDVDDLDVAMSAALSKEDQ